MSTINPAVSEIRHQDVLVRGFREIPAKLVAVACAAGVVYATGDLNYPPLGFHSNRVYAFNDEVFRELEAAGNAAELESIWKKADIFVPVISGGTEDA